MQSEEKYAIIYYYNEIVPPFSAVSVKENNMDRTDANLRMAQLLFPHITKTPDDYETIYPRRDLPQGAMVTRIAPSPTGFMHFGNLYGALIDERLAHQSGGVFYLRIENTDAKREVEGAVDVILTSLNAFGLNFDEGATSGEDKGPSLVLR